MSEYAWSISEMLEKNSTIETSKQLTFSLREGLMSEKDHVTLHQQEPDRFDLGDFNRKAATKLRNRFHAKRSRDRKKEEQQHLLQRISELEARNSFLENLKTCPKCKAKLKGNSFSETSNFMDLEYASSNNEQRSKAPKLSKNNQGSIKFEPKVRSKGKTLVAVGVVLLLVGMSLLGLYKQSEPLKTIQIREESATRILQEYYDSSEEPIEVSLKARSRKQTQVQPEGTGDFNFERLLEIEPHWSPVEDQRQDLDTRIDRDLLYAIQAEIDGFGWYI